MPDSSFELIPIGSIQAHPNVPSARAAICDIGDLPAGTILYYKQPTHQRKHVANLHITSLTDPKTRESYRDYKIQFLEQPMSLVASKFLMWFNQTPVVENEQPDVVSHVDGSISHHMWNVVIGDKEPGAYPLYTE